MSGPIAAAVPPGYTRRATILALLGLGLAIYLMFRVGEILLVAFFAMLLSVYFSTLTTILCRRMPRLPRGVGLALALVITIAILGGIGALLIPAVMEQVQDLLIAAPGFIGGLDTWIRQYAADHPLVARTGIAADETGLLATVVTDAIEYLRRSFIGYATLTGRIFIDGVAVIVMALYLSWRPHVYKSGIVILFPPERRVQGAALINDIIATLRAWVGAQMLAMVVLAILTGIGLWLLDVPYWLAFSLFTGVVVMVPFFGTIVSTLLPALLVLPGRGPLAFVAVAMVGIVVHIVEANLVHPLIMQHRVALPPVLTILSVLVMGSLSGLLGLLVAVPLLATIMVIVRHVLIYWTYGERMDEVAPPPAVLRPSHPVLQPVTETG